MMMTHDFAGIVQDLVATGLAPNQIAASLGVNRSTVCRWRQGECAPRGVALLALLDLAEDWTEKRLKSLRTCNWR